MHRDDGAWLGADGDHWFVVRQDENGIDVRTNATLPQVESFFRLDWNAREVEARIVERGPEMEPYMRALPGLRVLRPSNPYETFFSFLCTPNNNIARITGMVRSLAAYGEPMEEVEGVQIHRFPSAQIIAAIPEAELRHLRFGYRAGTIVRAAHQTLVKGEGWLEKLKTVPYEEAFRELTTISGVGPKLADCIALFALDHTEAVPVDTHVWQQAVRHYRPDWAGKSLTASRYQEVGDIFRTRFGDLAGWAHQYLFYENLVNWRSRR